MTKIQNVPKIQKGLERIKERAKGNTCGSCKFFKGTRCFETGVEIFSTGAIACGSWGVSQLGS